MKPKNDNPGSINAGRQYDGSTQYGDLLKVSAYDRVSSVIVSLLVMLGVLVGMLVVLWWTSQMLSRATTQDVFLVEEEGEQEGEQDAREIQEPGMEDLALAEPDVQDTLAAVTDAVSSVAASLDAIDSAVSSRGQGAVDSRKAGNGVIPRWQRWEIRYIATTLDAYAKQLQFFGIELGAMGGGRPGIDYAYFQQSKLVKKQQPAGQEDKRLYFIWQGGKFQQQDRSLLSQASVNTQGRVTCQFFSPELENSLAVLEQKELGNRTLKQVRKTIFGVRPAGKSFEFYVVEVQWRS